MYRQRWMLVFKWAVLVSVLVVLSVVYFGPWILLLELGVLVFVGMCAAIGMGLGG